MEVLRGIDGADFNARYIFTNLHLDGANRDLRAAPSPNL